jgi:cell fate regulator YaaT (PSP1 superfamily)
MSGQQRMPVGVRFKEAGKVYYFDARGLDLFTGAYVVVDTSHGQEVGRVVISPDQVIASQIKETLKPIIRIATQEDLDRAADLKKRAHDELAPAREEAVREGADMRIVGADYALDGSQLTFYFTAADRVEFRNLARNISERLDVRVQFLQVGDRDRAKMVDGIGRCGERLCCSSWLTTFPTVSIRQAKEQDLPLNPSKLSGACGRLLCCLTYEYEQYREIKGGLPKVGARISTPTGEARVSRISALKETITLWVPDGTGLVEMPLDQFRLMYGTAIRPRELTEQFEKQLFEKEGAAPAEAPPQQPPQPPRHQAPRPQRPRFQAPRPPQPPHDAPRDAPGQQQQQPADGRARRRRRRRGGRGRRSGGGPPPA